MKACEDFENKYINLNNIFINRRTRFLTVLEGTAYLSKDITNLTVSVPLSIYLFGEDQLLSYGS